MELFRGIDEALPRPVGLQLDEEDLTKIPRINVRSVTAQRYADVKTWFDGLRDQDKNFLTEEEKATGPSGEGYIITLMCEHYFAPEDRLGGGVIFVRDTLVENLRKPFIQQKNNFVGPVPVSILGISHPVITDHPPPSKVEWFPNGAPKTGDTVPGGFRPGFPGQTVPGRPALPGRPAPGTNLQEPQSKLIDRTTFTLQFAWKPTLVKDRVMPETAQPESADGDPTGATGTQPGAPPTGVAPGTPNPGTGLPDADDPGSTPALGQ